MDRQTFIWGRSGNRIRKTQRWVERVLLLGLFLAALLLFTINLESPPLLRWEKTTIDLVARGISQTSLGYWQWFDPTLKGELNLEEPPLLHWLIAFAHHLGGNRTGMTRLPGTILSALSVPLLYGIAREIFPARQTAIFASLIYLTLFPVIYYGRLAISDGMGLCFFLLTMWCLLRSRRDLRYALGAGIGLGLICLSKGVLLGLFLLAIVIAFLAWDTPRLLTSGYWWLGWFLGIVPGLAWYCIPLLEGQTSIATNIINHSLKPLWFAVDGYGGHPWYYLIELLKFSSPWLLFWPCGLWLAWQNRNWGWAKLVLVWTFVVLGAISLMVTKLPWNALPIYPALALAGGAQLADIWNWPSSKSYPRIWTISLSLMAVGAISGTIFFIWQTANYFFPAVSSSLALTMGISAILLARRNLQFIFVLCWGMYISLILLMASSYWEPLGLPI